MRIGLHEQKQKHTTSVLVQIIWQKNKYTGKEQIDKDKAEELFPHKVHIILNK